MSSEGRRKNMSKRQAARKRLHRGDFINNIYDANLYRKHNMAPIIFQDRKMGFFREGDRPLSEALAPSRIMSEVENIKRTIGEIIVSNDILANLRDSKKMRT